MRHYQQFTRLGLAVIAVFSIFGNATQAITPNDAETVTSNELSNQANNSVQAQDPDVPPDDWTFAVLHHLAEKYDCASVFSEGTFSENHPLNRDEFATEL